MTIKEIVAKFGDLKVLEREQSDAYAEFTIFNKEIDEWNSLLKGFFGPEAKPADDKPTEDQMKLTQDYGCIYSGQTLYKKDFDDHTIIAMLWPWSDKIQVTLKLAVIPSH